MQDPGGARYLAPLLSRLTPRNGARVFAHPFAEDVLSQARIRFEKFEVAPDEPSLRAFLRREGFSRLVCTLSAKLDLTNALLISAADAEGLASFGVMDHWKGFSRLLDEEGKPRYAPGRIGCIDAVSRRRLVRLAGAASRVHALGHPHLETLAANRRDYARTGLSRLLAVSQPDPRDRNWRSVFAPHSWRLLREIALAAREAGSAVSFRAHPKENDAGSLPEGVMRDETRSLEETLAAYDVFVGVDSMLLIEAAVAGRHCVSLTLPDREDPLDEGIPYQIGENATPGDAAAAVARAIARAASGPSDPPADLDEAVCGSVERGVRCLEEFLTQGASVTS